MDSNKKRIIKSIYKGIKEIRIQGATSVARAAIIAYTLEPTIKNKRKLLSLRPTEPMLSNSINFLKKWPKRKVIQHFDEAQKKINEEVYKILSNKKAIMTHCHSTNVVKALIYSKRKGRNFEVINTETRPLFQGRKTARELSREGIKVTTFVDSGMHEALKKAEIILVGADAILKNGAINKVGSDLIAEISYVHKKPLYVVSDSWKFSPKNVKIEERDFHEVWKRIPKHVKVENPAFELIEKNYITGIVSELGILKFNDFIKKAGKIIN